MNDAKSALDDGRLAEALGLLRTAPRTAPTEQLFFLQLLILSGLLKEATRELDSAVFEAPLLRSLTRLLARRRCRPKFLIPPPKHAVKRWNARAALRRGETNVSTSPPRRC